MQRVDAQLVGVNYMNDGRIYVWHCPSCDNKGACDVPPPGDIQMCLKCGDVLLIETMLPLYLFD